METSSKYHANSVGNAGATEMQLRADVSTQCVHCKKSPSLYIFFCSLHACMHADLPR